MTDLLLELGGPSSKPILGDTRWGSATERGWEQEFDLGAFVSTRKGKHFWRVVSDSDSELKFTPNLLKRLTLQTYERSKDPTSRIQSCGGLTLMHLWHNRSLIPESWSREQLIVFSGITIIKLNGLETRPGSEHNIGIFRVGNDWHSSLTDLTQELFWREAIYTPPKK